MIPSDLSASRRVLLAGVAGLGLLTLPACATMDMPQPKYPIYMQDKAPTDQATAVAPAAAPEAAPPEADTSPAISAPDSHGTIATTDLPPPPPPPPPPEDAAPAAAPPPAKPVAVATPASVASAPARDSRAVFAYDLQSHDTLYGVSRRFGVPVQTIYDINGFSASETFRIGQRVLLPAAAMDKGAEEHANGPGLTRLASADAPTKPVAAPVTQPPVKVAVSSAPPPAKPVSPPPAPASKPTVTTVADATPAKPVASPPAKSVTTTTTTTTTTTATPTPPPATPTRPAPTSAPPPSNGAFPGNSQLTQMGKGMFVWPVKGKIVVPFGQLAPNVRNDGINIAASQGTDVVAAADGMVVYEGDQVKELGNTIYIKHPGGWYTGYSHLSGMAVKNNEKVTKGQVIGQVGQTGVIDKPQLHFEIRYTPSTDIAKPIDPNLVLP